MEFAENERNEMLLASKGLAMVIDLVVSGLCIKSNMHVLGKMVVIGALFGNVRHTAAEVLKFQGFNVKA